MHSSTKLSVLALVFALCYFYYTSDMRSAKAVHTPTFINETCLSTPPSRSCAFYSTCLEPHFHCGPDGYPLGYGDLYCNKFSSPTNLARFTGKGQSWMWDTMHCLQVALVSELEKAVVPSKRDEACKDLRAKAFASHAPCYVASGVCSLPINDWETIVDIVGGITLFRSWDAFKQSLQTAEGCAELYSWLS